MFLAILENTNTMLKQAKVISKHFFFAFNLNYFFENLTLKLYVSEKMINRLNAKKFQFQQLTQNDSNFMQLQTKYM